MSTARHFSSYTEARQQLRAVLDAADQGLVTTIDRDDQRFIVVSSERQRQDLAALRPAGAVVVAEGGGWAVILPGLPVHGDGETFDDAIGDAMLALRDYAEDWNLRLRHAPNHLANHVPVQLVELSSDEQLREWLLGGPGVAADHAGVPGQPAPA